MPTLTIPCPAGQVSDGYHTFDELYDHRCTLFLALMKQLPAISWYSDKHHEGDMFSGWFIAGINLPTGVITYHLPMSLWAIVELTQARSLPRAPRWDGHTAADVIKRVREWVRMSPIAT